MSMSVALELYSVRDLYRTNFDECLQKVAAIGYAGVECFGGPTLPAETVLQSLTAHGLKLVGWHTPIELLEGDNVESTVAYFRQVGCTRAVVPAVPAETFQSREAVLVFAKRMDAIYDRLATYGIEVGYHNHGAEFIPLADGALPWAVLMDHTRILGQLDNGNALTSKTPGLDVTALVAQWPGRAKTIHAKPYSYADGEATMIGQDDIDWPAFLKAAEEVGGTEWIIVEYEDEAKYTQFEGAKACYDALMKFL